MKRRPVRLLPAVADNRELFPDSLYHSPEAESSPHRVQQLLGEQSALMEKAHIHVVGPRSYLRSPPRRLHFIEAGFQRDASSPPSDRQQPQDDVAQQQQGAEAGSVPQRHPSHKKHSPLPPLQSVPLSTAGGGAAATASPLPPDLAATTVAEMSSLVERFLAAHPNVSREELVRPTMAGTDRPLRSHSAIDLVVPTVASAGGSNSRPMTPRNGGDGSVMRSISSAHIPTGSADEFLKSSSQARTELTGYCAPYVPKLVLCNIASSNDDDGDGGVGEAASTSNGCTFAFRPWQGPAALLFIDISGYSKATTALAPFGPHALSEAVNGYLDKIIDTVVNGFGGDILKFAGDAILAAWVPPSHLKAQQLTPAIGGGDDAAPNKNDAKHKHHATAAAAAPEEEEDASLQLCCASAVACAFVLQRDYAVHPIPYVEDSMNFTLHIGVVCGTIETAVFCFPNAKNTESAFHSISGAPLQEVGTVVDAAASREICISNRVHSLLSKTNASLCSMKDVPLLKKPPTNEHQTAATGTGGDSMESRSAAAEPTVVCHKLEGIDVDNALRFVAAAAEPPQNPNPNSSRSPAGDDGATAEDEDAVGSDWQLWERIVGDFVHPALKRRFASSASNVAAEMRFLAVLFISKSDRESDLNEWFAEVQTVLDDHRCAIVKLIDDDKGVHVIAAAGLFASERNASLTAVEAAQELAVREAGCNTGIAAGLTFCGVIGSTELSCRWDITGASCVRSCRLMQHAMAGSPPGGCFVDASVLEHIGNRSMLNEHSERLVVKGSPEPVQAFVLSSGSIAQPAWLLTRVPPMLSQLCHHEQRLHLRRFLNDSSASNTASSDFASARRISFTGGDGDVTSTLVPRCVVVVSGPAGIGKGTLAVVASQDAHYTAVLHEAVRDAPPFAIAATLAKWFSFHPVPALRTLAECVASAQTAQHGGRTRRLLLQLIAAAEDEGSRMVLVIKHAQLLDATSLSFLCAILRPKHRRRASSTSTTTPDAEASAPRTHTVDGHHRMRDGGSFACILCATPTYGSTTPTSLLRTLQSRLLHETTADHAVAVASTTHVSLTPLNEEAARDVASKTFSWDIDDSLFRVLHLYTDGVPALIQAYAQHIMAQRPYLTTMSAQGIVYLSSEGRKKVSAWSWISICAAFAPQLLQLYDAVTPKHRVVLRVVACLMCQVGDRVLVDVVAHVVNKLLHQRTEALSHVKDMLHVLAAHDLVCSDDGTAAAIAADGSGGGGLYKCTAADAAATLYREQQRQSGDSDDGLPFSATVRIASVALRDAIQQTVTPDHRSLILGIASKYMQSVIQAKTAHGAYGWVCGAWLVVSAARVALAAEERGNVQQRQQRSGTAAATQHAVPSTTQQQLANLGDYCTGTHGPQLSQAVQRLREAYALDPEPPFTPLTFTASISLDVVGIKNYAPPISLGSGVGGLVFELCWWMRNAYVLLARKMPVPEKAAAHGRVLTQRFATHFKCIAKALSAAPPSITNGATHPLLSESHSATFSIKAISEDEATLNGIMQDLLLASVKNMETAGAAAAQGCKDLAAFFSRRLVPCALAFQEAVGELIVAAGPTVVMEESQVPAHLDVTKSSSMLALIRALRVFAAHAATTADDASLDVALFHQSMMALSTSDFSTGSAKFSLPWVRDMVLKDKKESTRAFRSCVYADYLYAVAAAALAARRASSIGGMPGAGAGQT